MKKHFRNTPLYIATVTPLCLSAVNAFALDTNMDTLFAAVDISGMALRVTTLLAIAIGIPVLWFGYRQLKKVTNRAA